MQALQDLKYAVRQIAKSPGFALLFVLTLALGMGANSALFSVAEGVLLRPLPYAHGDRLVHIGTWLNAASTDDVRFSPPEVADYRQQTHTLAGIAEYHSMTFNLVGRGEPYQVKTGVVSANLFSDLGIRPLLGRLLRPDDDQMGAPRVLMLTHRFWLDRLGADPHVVGQVFRMNGDGVTVVGVLPPLPDYPEKDDVYVPVSVCPVRSREAIRHNREARFVRLLGWMKPGATPAAVATDVATVTRRLHQEYASAYKKGAVVDIPVTPVREELTRDFRPTLLILLGTVGMVLLLGCANLGNLALARLLGRDREIVVRSALGASRRRLLRQFMTESTLLSLLGGALGLLLAFSTKGLLTAFAGRFTPRSSEIAINGPVLLFTFLVALAVGLLLGVVPALQVTRREIVTALKEGSGRTTLGAGGRRLQATFIVIQVALSFVLLVGAGLMLRSVVELDRVQLGFAPQNVVTMTLTLSRTKYREEAQSRHFFDQVRERLAANPRIRSVALSTDAPLNGGVANPNFTIEGAPSEDQPQAAWHNASPDYFRALGIPLLRGRMFAEGDHETAPLVALVNQTLVKQYFSGADPIGKRLQVSDGAGGLLPWRTIVGVVGDVKQHGLEADAGAGIYFPFKQEPSLREQLFVRAAGNPESVVREGKSVLREIDPEQPIANVQTLEQLRSDLIAPSRLTATLLGLFALLAFVITATGIGGVTAFQVSQRTREIGIRSALGAQPPAVLGLVLGESLKLVAMGLIAGVLGALFLSQLFTSLLFGVKPADPGTYLAVLLSLLAVVALASLLPARRAAKLDPAIALRTP